MPFGAWRFKSSHPHSETPETLPVSRCGGFGRRVCVGRRPRGAGSADDGGDRDPEGAGADRVRALAHLCPPSRLRARARGSAGAGRTEPARGGAGRTDPLALPHRRERLRGGVADRGALAARAPPRHRAGLAERHLPLVVDSNRQFACTDRRRQDLGPDADDGRQRDEDRDHRRRARRHPSLLQSDRPHVSARIPEGPHRPDDTEGDRAARVRARVAEVQVRDSARSTRGNRSTRPTSPASPPAITARTRGRR